MCFVAFTCEGLGYWFGVPVAGFDPRWGTASMHWLGQGLQFLQAPQDESKSSPRHTISLGRLQLRQRVELGGWDSPAAASSPELGWARADANGPRVAGLWGSSPGSGVWAVSGGCVRERPPVGGCSGLGVLSACPQRSMYWGGELLWLGAATSTMHEQTMLFSSRLD